MIMKILALLANPKTKPKQSQTNPIRTQFEPNSKPIRTQFKANQTQFIVSLLVVSKVELSNHFYLSPSFAIKRLTHRIISTGMIMKDKLFIWRILHKQKITFYNLFIFKMLKIAPRGFEPLLPGWKPGVLGLPRRWGQLSSVLNFKLDQVILKLKNWR